MMKKMRKNRLNHDEFSSLLFFNPQAKLLFFVFFFFALPKFFETVTVFRHYAFYVI